MHPAFYGCTYPFGEVAGIHECGSVPPADLGHCFGLLAGKNGIGGDHDQAVSELREKPDIVIVVTDGWGPAPTNEPQGYKTIWLEVGRDATPPCEWGDHIKLED